LLDGHGDTLQKSDARPVLGRVNARYLFSWLELSSIIDPVLSNRHQDLVFEGANRYASLAAGIELQNINSAA
jgi:hypothetical protein